MIYLESPKTDPYFNLALEQHVFDCLPRSEEYFMLWRNANSVIVGRHQNTIEEINSEYVRQREIRVARRLSGGGAVYHDLGNLNFTFVMNAGGLDGLDLKLFSEPVARALRRLGVAAEVNGRNDITIDGKKFSGNSQYLKDGRLMHHGTIMFSSDLDALSGALCVGEDKIVSKGVKSVRSRVTNVADHLPARASVEEFAALLLENMFEGGVPPQYHLSCADLLKIERLRRERYATWEWNYGNSPEFTVRKKHRFEGCGTVEACISVHAGLITDLRFYGDFFSADDPGQLAQSLIGMPYDNAVISKYIETLPVGSWFKNLDAASLAALLVS